MDKKQQTERQKLIDGQVDMPDLRHFLKKAFYQFIQDLKVVSATFLEVCFLSPKENTCGTRKNVFYFTSKALFCS